MSKTPILKPAEVAARLGVTAATVRRWSVEGTLKARVLPSGHRRYEETDVQAFEDRTRPAS